MIDGLILLYPSLKYFLHENSVPRISIDISDRIQTRNRITIRTSFEFRFRQTETISIYIYRYIS